jgi:general L-amino acid transport system permease protein
MSNQAIPNPSFVREAMLPPREPPATEVGAVKWLRENLFSTWLNTALTVLGFLAVGWILWHVVPWLMNGVWDANSLGECREKVAALHGPDASGACFAAIKERWHQWIFGFYPPELYWRPTLAMVLALAALVPILFDWAPRKLLWLSVVAPFLTVWLIWGGSFWGPFSVMAAFAVIGVLVYLYSDRLGGILTSLIVIGLVLALFLNPVSILISILRNIVTLFGILPWDPLSFLTPVGDAAGWIFPLSGNFAELLHQILPVGIEAVDSDRFGGFLLSITIGLTAIVCSLPIGILLALGRRSDMPLVKMLSVGFIEFIRGVPLITMLFTATLLLQYFLPPGTNFDVILRVIIMVTVFSAAYIAEVIRGGLAALPRGQYEAADALGLDYWQAQRHIIMPQALKISIPGIVSSFIGLFKDTTLVALVGLLDPLQGITKIVRADIAWKGLYWEPYVLVGLIFFVFCFGMSRYSMYLERRLKRDHS